MRILFLCHRFLDTQIGGMAEFLTHLPVALKSLGVEIILYTQSENNTNDVVTLPNGIMCYRGPFLKPGWFTSSKKLSPLLEICKKEKINLIHAQGIYRSGYMAMKAAKKLRIPYIVTSHSDILTAGSDRMKRGKIQKRCADILKQTDGVTHLTPMMAETTHAIYDTRNKSFIIGNGIDLSAWNYYRNSSEKNYMLAIGRLEREKGFHILIDAFAQFIKSGGKSSFIIAGSGSEEKNLQEQAKQLGLNVITDFKDITNIPESNIIFTGYIQGDMKMGLMSQTQIVLFAPQPKIWEEPFGIVQIEAMAAGKALIASDTAATRYLQKSGLQVRTVIGDDVNAWSKEMTALINNNDSRTEMGNKNLDNAKQFNWGIVAEKYVNSYKNVIINKIQ